MFDQVRQPSWPKEPYKGLANYEVEDELLFSGRKVERRRCLQLLAQAETRVLILHGQTGCGKSSFLRAGLIPELERNGNAYAFLRRRQEGPDSKASPVFIRCGHDPVARIAEEIFLFTGEKISVLLGDGTNSTIDLEAARHGNKTLDDFIKACTKDSDVLLKAIAVICKRLPYTLVLILDQVEEVITQTDSPERATARRRFFAFIKDLAVSRVNMRFIVAIRKDHSGQFIGSIQVDSKISPAFKAFFLPDLPKEGMREAILRPTQETSSESAAMLPPARNFYNFEFGPGVVDKMVTDLNSLLPSGSALPVMQIVCRDLVEQIGGAGPSMPLRQIPMDLYLQGEITGRVQRHLLGAIEELNCDPEVGVRLPDGIEKWMRVLKRFVQEEGDGRMHTDLVALTQFTQWIREAGLQVNADKAIDKLIDPRFLMLRQFAVFAPGAKGDRLLLCLGHDLIGNAIVDYLKVLDATKLAEAKAGEEAQKAREEAAAAAQKARDELAEAARRSEEAIRLEKGRRVFLRRVTIGLASVVVVVAFAGIYNWNKARGRQIASLLNEADLVRRTDIVEALAYASRAAHLTLKTPRNDDRAASVLESLAVGLPLAIVPEPPHTPQATIASVQPLPQRAGFAILDTSGALQIVGSSTQQDKSVVTYDAVADLQVGHDGDKLEIISFSEGKDGTVLAKFQRTVAPVSNDQADTPPRQGVVAFFPDRTTRVYRLEELLKPVGEVGAFMSVSGVADSRVILMHSPKDNDPVLATLRITHLQRDPSLVQSPWPVSLSRSSVMLPLGPHLFDFEFKGDPTRPSPGIPAPEIGRVTVREVDPTSKPTSWKLEEQGFMKECNSNIPTIASKKLLCEATLVNDLLQGGVFTMVLWRFFHPSTQNDRLGPYGRAFVSHLIMVDPRGPNIDAVGLDDLARMRMDCGGRSITSRPAGDLFKEESQDSFLPAFIAQSGDDVLLVFRSEGAAQLVTVNGSRVKSCREIYLPQTPTFSWASNNKAVIATAPRGGFRWAPLGEAETSEPRYERLQIICSGAFGRAERSSGRQNPANREAHIKDICG